MGALVAQTPELHEPQRDQDGHHRHGGAIAEPEDTAYLYEQTDAQGFVGASSIERIPIERAIHDTVAALKNQSPRRRPA